MRADVAVIGGGVIGCAVAYYLATKGARVTIVEQSVIGRGASSANSGAIAMATKKPGLALDLAMASQCLYPELGEALGADLEYSVQGNLIVAESETEMIFLEQLAREQQATGVAAEIVDGPRCRSLNPLLEGPVLAGLYCPTDAQVDPFKVTQAFAVAAQNAGTRVLTGTRVDAIHVERGRVSGIATSAGKVEAAWVVNAAGAHADAVGRMVGVEHGVKPRRGQIAVLEADRMPPVRVAAAGSLLAKHGTGDGQSGANVALSYLSRPASGTVLLGSTNEFAGFDTRTTREGVAEICAGAMRLMPRLGDMSVVRTWAGLRPYRASGPGLGDGGGPRGYVIAIGHGGDGVALSPITGVYVSEFIAREGRACALRDFLAEHRAALLH
ncbi:MAG: NAD(P)/FAD-dependent oxidoreductase [Burkholderiales bacterium]